MGLSSFPVHGEKPLLHFASTHPSHPVRGNFPHVVDHGLHTDAFILPEFSHIIQCVRDETENRVRMFRVRAAFPRRTVNLCSGLSLCRVQHPERMRAVLAHSLWAVFLLEGTFFAPEDLTFRSENQASTFLKEQEDRNCVSEHTLGFRKVGQMLTPIRLVTGRCLGMGRGSWRWEGDVHVTREHSGLFPYNFLKPVPSHATVVKAGCLGFRPAPSSCVTCEFLHLRK